MTEEKTPSDASPPKPLPSPWWLRRADQAGVAVLVALAMAATVGWWVRHSGLGGDLVEVEHAEPQAAVFDVDINTADWPELAQLPALGETLARRIVETREKNGPFRSPDDLRRVRGIGPKTLETIRPYLRKEEGGKGEGRKEEG
jgi:competence protein ComEA